MPDPPSEPKDDEPVPTAPWPPSPVPLTPELTDAWTPPCPPVAYVTTDPLMAVLVPVPAEPPVAPPAVPVADDPPPPPHPTSAIASGVSRN